MRARICMLLTLLVMSSLMSGCWDRKEINDIGIQMLTALDKGEEPGTYRALVQVAVPRNLGGSQGALSEGGKNPVATLTMEGRTMDGITTSIERKLPRDLLSTHRRVFLFGEPLAREGLYNMLDHMTRSPEMRLNIYMCVAKQMNASEIAKVTGDVEAYPVEFFREMIERKMKIPSTIRNFLIALDTPGKEPIAAAFSADPLQKNMLLLDSIAIFRKLQLVGFVSDREASALISILGHEPLETIELDMPNEKKNVIVRLTSMKVDRKLKIIGGEPSFSFKVTVDGRISEDNANLDLSNPNSIKELDVALGQEITQLYKSLFRKLQREYHADSVGLGAMIYRQHPKYWAKIEKDWPAMYAEQKINWSVKANIRQTGAFGAPSYLPEEEVKK